MYISIESIIGLALIVAVLHYGFTWLDNLLGRLPPYDHIAAANKRRAKQGLAPYTSLQELIRGESKE